MVLSSLFAGWSRWAYRTFNTLTGLWLQGCVREYRATMAEENLLRTPRLKYCCWGCDAVIADYCGVEEVEDAVAVLTDGCGGRLNPNLSLFAGGWEEVIADFFCVKEVKDAVVIIVDGFGTGVWGVGDWSVGGGSMFSGWELSWCFLHKGRSSNWSNSCINWLKFHVIQIKWIHKRKISWDICHRFEGCTFPYFCPFKVMLHLLLFVAQQ